MTESEEQPTRIQIECDLVIRSIRWGDMTATPPPVVRRRPGPTIDQIMAALRRADSWSDGDGDLGDAHYFQYATKLEESLREVMQGGAIRK